MEYVNLEEFEKWINENTKPTSRNVKTHLMDLDDQYIATGRKSYELSALDSNKGTRMEYHYEIEFVKDAEGKVVGEKVIF